MKFFCFGEHYDPAELIVRRTPLHSAECMLIASAVR